jgi:hypothetical protein
MPFFVLNIANNITFWDKPRIIYCILCPILSNKTVHKRVFLNQPIRHPHGTDEPFHDHKFN